ncbi:hypothetical protein LOAG_13192, partial [Loa loa]
QFQISFQIQQHSMHDETLQHVTLSSVSSTSFMDVREMNVSTSLESNAGHYSKNKSNAFCALNNLAKYIDKVSCFFKENFSRKINKFSIFKNNFVFSIFTIFLQHYK